MIVMKNTKRGVKKIKTYERQIQMTTGDLIPIDMIFGIDGKIFSRIDY